jgi:hypothetical protein
MKKTFGFALVFLGASMMAAAAETEPPRAPVNAAFQKMKALVGDWSGTADGKPVHVSYTLVSDGSALMERLTPAAETEMISMYSPDGDGIVMTHYCSMHNQPRMRADGVAADGTIHFKFVDGTNMAPSDPHMDHVTVTLPDGGKFKQEWTFRAGGKDNSEVFSYSR